MRLQSVARRLYRGGSLPDVQIIALLDLVKFARLEVWCRSWAERYLRSRALITVPTPIQLLAGLGRLTSFSVWTLSLIVRDCLRSAVAWGVRSVRVVAKYGLVVQALAVVLTPMALMASVLSLWRIGAGLHLTSRFVITTGPFSLWETWLGMAVLLESFDLVLDRTTQRVTRL